MKITHTRDYREARKTEYPDIGDQLDTLVKYFSALPMVPPELQAWVAQCQTVKAKYPKPQ